jgi:hypothetical protein
MKATEKFRVFSGCTGLLNHEFIEMKLASAMMTFVSRQNASGRLGLRPDTMNEDE